MLHVRLLGELQADVDGRSVLPPPSRRAWSLLGWLALHPGEHPRGTVAAQFWPDVLDSSARASLRSAAWALRRAVGDDDALIAGRDRIGLRCSTDVAEFDAHCAAGRLEEAVALYRGPLLADLDEDWVLEARDEQAERLGSALARLAAAAAPADAVAYARRRLALDPLDEQAARDLMRQQVEAGDRAAALATFDRLGERLRTSLGLATSAETRALAASIRAESSGVPEAARGDAAPVRAVPRAATARVDEPPLVGRAGEQAALARLWEQVESGSGAIALISGEAGIGKTRLAADLLATAGAARIARATAVDLGGGAPPFGPWAELLAGLARQLEPPPADAQWPEELGRLAPSLPRRLGRPAAAPANVPPELARARLFEAAVELAEHATLDRPLVLLLDDVHLADAPTLELTTYLARRIRDLPVLLVLTRRPIPRRDAVDALVRAAGLPLEEVELGPLSPAEIERLVGPLPEVIATADGNPLLALETARTGGASLRGLVRAAIAGLPPDARRAAELAAVAGRDLDRAELARLADPEAVIQATDSGLFHSADGRFGFRHALLRDAVYADLDGARQTSHHETLGRVLTNAAECARHLRRAGRDDLAAGRLVQAAADAIRATAVLEAAEYLREAVELDPDPKIQLELAATLALLGERDASLVAFHAAAPHDARAHLRAAQWFHSSLCDPTSALHAAARGLSAPDGDVETQAELLLIRAWAEVATVGSEAAYRSLSEAEALGVDLTTDPLHRYHVDNLRGFIALTEGRLEESEAALVASGEAGELAGRPDLAYGGWANAACLAAVAGAYERALAHAERGAATAGGLPVIEFQLTDLRAFILARLGRHAEARAGADHMAEVAVRLGSPGLQATADHDGGLLALLAGDYERAQAFLARALASDAPIQRGEARLRRAEALARLGRADEADAEIRAAALEPMRPADRPAVLVARMAFAQGLSAAARGDAELAERRLGEAERHWRRLDADAGGEFLTSLVDLGRPPIAGIADPAYELARIAAELEAHAHVR